MHNTNAPADTSPCNGISAILGQHKACAQIAMIMNGCGLSPPPPFGLRSLYAHTSYHLTSHTSYHLTWHTAPMMHRSHKLATMSSYPGCLLRLFPNGPFTIHGEPSRIRLCRTLHDGLKCLPIRRRLGALGNTCYRRSPRAKTPRPSCTPLGSRIMAARMRTFSLPRQPGKILPKRKNIPGPRAHCPTSPPRSEPP